MNLRQQINAAVLKAVHIVAKHVQLKKAGRQFGVADMLRYCLPVQTDNETLDRRGTGYRYDYEERNVLLTMLKPVDASYHRVEREERETAIRPTSGKVVCIRDDWNW